MATQYGKHLCQEILLIFVYNHFSIHEAIFGYPSPLLTHMLLCVNDGSVQFCTKQLMLLPTLSPFSHLGTYVASASTRLISSLQAPQTKESVDRDMERAKSLAG